MSTATILQGTSEWKALRAGKVTASRISDVRAQLKSKPNEEAKTRRDYKVQILAEILTGEPRDSEYINRDMERGIELEPFARAAYEVREGVMVDQVPFVQHPTIERAGCSPDGLVGDDGLIEIKCPKTAIHIEYLLAGKVPTDYVPQLIWQLACTGREWVDFVSFDPTLPENLQLFVVRFAATKDLIESYEESVRQFLKEVNGLLTQLGYGDKVQ